MSVNIVWLRRDLRISDNPALLAASKTGNPLLPIFILDPETERLGAAFKWRLGLSLEKLDESLRKLGTRLVLLRGEPLEVLRKLVATYKAKKIFWNRLYDQDSIKRDTHIKSFFEVRGIPVSSYEGMLLLSPWKLKTNTGSFYKVFTPFWRALAREEIEQSLPSPSKIVSPQEWPKSEKLIDWELDKDIGKGKVYLIKKVRVGEEAAKLRFEEFLEKRISQYYLSRDRLDKVESSNLSENLAYGEISPRQIWHAVLKIYSLNENNSEMFVRQLAWRDFAWYLCFHCPHILKKNWKSEWDDFPWTENSDALVRWQRGITGVPIVDAGMRELYVTGRMHNRVRMIVASYLTKHLLIDWRHGLNWFADCLIDWDPASNALGWQWVAGSGPDASPFFRVFNPELQSKKFDPKGVYTSKFLKVRSEFQGEAQEYYDMVPKIWQLKKDEYPKMPIVDLRVGRDRALAAYSDFKKHLISGVSP